MTLKHLSHMIRKLGQDQYLPPQTEDGILFMHGEEAARYIPKNPEWIEEVNIAIGCDYKFAHIIDFKDCLLILDFRNKIT